ncbi:twitching motility protein PilT [Caminicella sporogenes DSM 14501]|uniref:Twitching motility protein PilT n=1 Tax=Caminicella sporogenes DSM 14501 TaxID=1121266 RepID=A0A1M6LP21_9FIRM|nr:type IV pilus twitching motility protein PilT [Caminicella sporogenes]RKD27901.1 type IV pili twitching motility protein PilT [Caminicella sporogenes]SHJ72956.1 twitching motility protein PilT [Caminicella sporogenes DSM 14501]
MDMLDLLKKTVEMNASDLHITVGVPPIIRINGRLERYGEKILTPDDTNRLVKQVLTENQFKKLQEKGEVDLSFSSTGLGRFRVNVYKQRGSFGMAIRVVALKIPSIEELGLPPVIKELASKKRGLILVTGPTGSGKSTTLAAMIDYINNNRTCHVLTLEDPIEYLHKHKKSIVNQREIGNDSSSYADALRAALRQDPDVILVGEMRDLETISTAITAAETGHLVMSTLHTIGAAKTVDRIIDVFPPYQQHQIRIQLSTVLEGIISQQLLPKKDGDGRVAALEIMIATTAIRNLIREGKTHQMQTIVQTGLRYGMKTMDSSISELYNRGIISRQTALNYAVEREMLEKFIGF